MSEKTRMHLRVADRNRMQRRIKSLYNAHKCYQEMIEDILTRPPIDNLPKKLVTIQYLRNQIYKMRSEGMIKSNRQVPRGPEVVTATPQTTRMPLSRRPKSGRPPKGEAVPSFKDEEALSQLVLEADIPAPKKLAILKVLL